MVKLIFEDRFLDTEWELDMLDEYRAVFEEQLSFVFVQQELRAVAKLESMGLKPGDDEYQCELETIQGISRDFFPRYLRGQLLVSLLAIVEATIKEIAEYIRIERGAESKLEDTKGDSPRKKWSTYFEDDLQYPLGFSKKTWDRIDQLRTVRIAFAHGLGTRTWIREKQYKKLKTDEWRKAGLVDKRLYVEPTAKYVEKMFHFVRETLSSLIVRVRGDFRTDDMAGGI